MKATKGNKVYTIDETQKAMYQAQGYDIVEDDETVIQYGAGKTVSYEKYAVLMKWKTSLEEKIAELTKENDQLRSKLVAIDTQDKEESKAKGKGK